jgi:hypothetical protein
MNSTLRLVRVILLVGCWCVAGLAQSGSPKAAPQTSSPRAVVSEYCRLDADGGLASSAGWPSISPLFVWPDAPGWDTFTVVRSYTVGKATQVGNTARVPVTYELIGTLDSTPRFVRAKVTKQTVVFHLVRNNQHWVLDADGNPDHQVASGVARWRIDKPQNEPHVSYERALQMAQEMLKNPNILGTAEDRRKGEEALQALQAAK